MLVSLPSKDHPIYQEWKKWRDRNEEYLNSEAPNPCQLASDACDSIAKIAKHFYPSEYSVVGHMIMMRDSGDDGDSSMPGRVHIVRTDQS